MLSQVLVFEQRQVRRVLCDDGELWFVLADVCEVFEAANPAQVSERLDADEKGICTVDTLRGPQQMLIVSEAGVYRIAHTSRKPVAKRFVRWVTHEVLPSIRRTGQYIAPGVETPSALSDLFDPIHRKLDEHGRKLDNLIDFQQSKRRFPSSATQLLHLKTVDHRYHGKCPCRECKNVILDENGRLRSDVEYHHQIRPWNNGPEETIPLAKACHARIERNSEARKRFNERAFQFWLENIEMERIRPPARIANYSDDVEFSTKAEQVSMFPLFGPTKPKG